MAYAREVLIQVRSGAKNAEEADGIHRKAAQALSRMEKVLFPAIGKISIAELRGHDILPCLRNYEAGTHSEMAYKIKRIASQICRHATC